MQQPITVEFDHGHSHYRATFDNLSDDFVIHHVTTRAGKPFERRIAPSPTPGLEVPILIDKAIAAFVDAVLDGAVQC